MYLHTRQVQPGLVVAARVLGVAVGTVRVTDEYRRFQSHHLGQLIQIVDRAHDRHVVAAGVAGRQTPSERVVAQLRAESKPEPVNEVSARPMPAKVTLPVLVTLNP
jgi:hypothetical protein